MSTQKRFKRTNRVPLPHRKPLGSPSNSSSSSVDDEDKDTFLTPRRTVCSKKLSTPLSESLKTQFKKDIERIGGLNSPDIAISLFDKKPDIYGSKGSETRKKFAKLFSNWKHRGPLSHVHINNKEDKQICSLPKNQQKMSRNLDRSYLAKFCPIGFEWETDDGQLGKFSSFANKIIPRHLLTILYIYYIADTEEHNVKFVSSPSGSLLKYPSYGGVEITKFTEDVHLDRVYDGFEIAVYTEYREVENGFVKAALLNPHEIAIQLPGLNYQFHEDYDTVWNKPIVEGTSVAMKNYFCDRLKVAHNKAMYKLRSNPHLRYRVIVLKFPRTIQLSNAIHSVDSIDGEVDSFVMPMVTPLPNTVVSSIRTSWKVHIHDEHAEQIGESAGNTYKKKNANLDRMNNMLSKMSIAPTLMDDDDE